MSILASVNGETLSILIIDDDRNLAEMLREMLGRAGCTPIVASDPAEGLELARSRKPDIVICDYVMPHATGLEVIAALRANPDLAKTAIVLMSAFTVPDAESRAADAMLLKPFLFSQLRRTLQRACAAQRRATGEAFLVE